MLSFALALLAGVVAQSLARHLRMPGIVVLLLALLMLNATAIVLRDRLRGRNDA